MTTVAADEMNKLRCARGGVSGVVGLLDLVDTKALRSGGSVRKCVDSKRRGGWLWMSRRG